MRRLLATGLLAACTSGGHEVASACAPNTIVVDDAALFWLDECDGSIMSLAHGAASPSRLASGQPRSASLVADAARLYWIAYTTDTLAEIRTMDKAGGAVSVLAANEWSPDTTPGRLVVDATNVYWVTTTGELRSVSKDGGGLATLASSERLSTPAADETYVYWSEGGAILRRAKSTGAIDTVVRDASTATFTADLVASRGRLYERVLYNVGEGSFALWSVDAVPDAQPAQLPMEAHDIGRTPMVLLADRLYWVQHRDVVSMRVDGSELRAEAALSDGGDATSLAVDADYVYWTDTRGGAVMRAPR